MNSLINLTPNIVVLRVNRRTKEGIMLCYEVLQFVQQGKSPYKG